MSFNFGLLKEIRVKNGITRSEFADLLGISEDRLYRFETGLSVPGIVLIERAAYYSGIPFRNFFSEDEDLPETPDRPSRLLNLLQLINSLKKVRLDKKMEEEKVSKLEKMNEHLIYVSDFQGKLTDILRQELPKSERSKKIAALARDAAKDGEMIFCEIASVSRVARVTLKRWLESGKTNYACRLDEERTVSASTPGEAEIQFACFDCEARSKGICRGYGNSCYPENFFVLINQLESNGIASRLEQSRILAETFGVELSPHQISEYISRMKKGKSVNEDIFDLKTRKRGKND
jgi:transcriptional regulator with XRE-family HTH domain